jgi:protein TonB
MAHLVNQTSGLKKSSDDENMINFLRTIPNSTTQTRRRSLPKKPPTPKNPPKMPKMAVQQSSDVQTPQLAMNVPMLSSPLALGDGPYLGGAVGGGGGSGDNDVIPLVRIEPQYPRKAAMRGTEGWVQLKFDITTAGTVENVTVLKSKPRRIFDQSAKRALSKWKYRPKMVDGKPVARTGLLVQLDFKIQR